MIRAYLFLQAALFLLSIGGFFQVQQFLKLNSSISTPANLDNFKRLARINMYVALVYIGLGIPSILMSMYLTFAEGVYGLGIVLATSVPQFLFGRYLKKLEDKTRSLHSSPQFTDAHHQIAHSWQKNALPDF